jgi:Flp pilus assembly protein TadD
VNQFVAALLAIALVTGRAAAQQDSTRAALETRVAQGDLAWDREDHPAARAAYGFVVRADSTFSTRALFRLGLLHAWDSRIDDALSALRRYVRAEPADLVGRVALARTYAWASRFPASLAQYDTVLARDAAYRDAVIGKGQALAWDNQLLRAEAHLERWLDGHADDVEAWTLLGQFRRWRGDARAAEVALDRALALKPGDPSALEQMAWVRVERHPAVTWSLVGAKDSERNTLWHRELGVEAGGWGNSRIGVVARLREASVENQSAVVIPGAMLFVTGRPLGRNVTTRAEIGAVQYPDGLAPAATKLRGGLRVTGSPISGLRLSAGGSRDAFDEVLSTARRGLMFTVFDVDASYALAPKWQVGLAGTAGVADGEGVLASRQTMSGALRFLPRRGTQLSLSHREAGWNTPQFGVFFAPQRWATTELALSSERTAELGLILAGDLAVASQLVGFESSPLDHAIVPRATMRMGYRLAPGREVLLGLVYANVAGAGAITASDYRYGAATLGGRWTF